MSVSMDKLKPKSALVDHTRNLRPRDTFTENGQHWAVLDTTPRGYALGAPNGTTLMMPHHHTMDPTHVSRSR